MTSNYNIAMTSIWRHVRNALTSIWRHLSFFQFRLQRHSYHLELLLFCGKFSLFFHHTLLERLLIHSSVFVNQFITFVVLNLFYQPFSNSDGNGFMDSMVTLGESLIPDGSNIEVLEIITEREQVYQQNALTLALLLALHTPYLAFHRGWADLCRIRLRTIHEYSCILDMF